MYTEMERVFENAEKILLITHSQNNKNEQEIQKFFKNKNIEFNIFKTKKLHDRLWIKNKEDYIIVGNSFNGIGFSFGFIYSLARDITKRKIQDHLIKKIMDSHLSKIDKKKFCEYVR